MVGATPHIFRGGAIVAIVMVLAGCGGSDADKSGGDARRHVTKLVLAQHSRGTEGVGEWASAVERLSNHTIDVVIKTDWRVDQAESERAMINDVRAGRVDLAAVSARAFDEVGVTTFEPLEAPLLIDSRTVEHQVLAGEIGRTALTGTRELGLEGLALMPTDLRRPTGLSRPLVDPADWRGARIYTREGAIARRTIEALGATPVHQPLYDWYRDVDGAEIGLGAVRSVPEVAQSAQAVTANVVLWPQVVAIVMDRKAFEDFSEAQRRALADASKPALTAESKFVQTIAKDDQAAVCRLGLKLVDATPSELSALRDAVAPIYDAIERHPGNREAMAAIRALKGDAAPDSLRCAGGSENQAAGGKGDPRLAGTYSTTVTERELATSRLLTDKGEINDENWGRMEILLSDDGKLRITQRNSKTSSELTGTYSVDGHAITFNVDSIGETFAFHWSLYRDKLRLIRDEKLGVAPTPLVMKAFSRKG